VNEAVAVALIAAIGGVIVALVQRSRVENSADHARVMSALVKFGIKIDRLEDKTDRVDEKIERVEDKLERHITRYNIEHDQ
jgi:hypothetical protein